ncbi:MAG: hypothetical protein R3B60_03740 [Candidatus Paceibacterota bacterium]
MITRQDKLSILITFIMGFVAGFYFFLTGFHFEFSLIPDSKIYDDYTIEAEAYGSCSVKGCMSFQLIVSTGSYRLLTTKTEVGDIIKEGVIDRSLRNELQRMVNLNELEKQTSRRLVQKCDSKEGGVDYNFKITIDSEEYILDTCRTTVDYNSRTWTSLEKLWSYFETI